MSKKLKKKAIKIFIGLVGYILITIFVSFLPKLQMLQISQEMWDNIELLLYLFLYLYIGGEIVKKAVKNIGNGQLLDENFLMTLATVGAFLISEYTEAVAVMLFYQIGEWFQSYAVGKSRKSIASLMDIRPEYANVFDGKVWKEISPEQVKLQEIIMIKPGERVPLDAIVLKGTSTLDTSALTGESMPRDIVEGDELISGCINLTGTLEAKVIKLYGESTVNKILELVENASDKKAKAEDFISKFAKYYTPSVVACAVILAAIPPILGFGSFTTWIYRALTFLVVSCPCALVISIPLSFFGGIGGASKAGILVKGGNYLEAISKVSIIAMDKTGTLTKGCFKIQEIITKDGISKDKVLEIAAIAESQSTHPIAKSIIQAYGKEVQIAKTDHMKEIAGQGIIVTGKDQEIYVGNDQLMETLGIETVDDAIATVVHVAVKDNKNINYYGSIRIADELKKDANQAVNELHKLGIHKLVMLTGDKAAVAENIAKKLKLDEFAAELLPIQKVSKIEELLSKKVAKETLAFVGDGINDAPVLARSDVGIAMGGLGSDAAIEAADIVIMTDEPSKIAQAIRIAKHTMQIVHQNIVFAIGIKVLVLLLAAAGMANMWLAIFADVGVAVIAILNAMRALKVK